MDPNLVAFRQQPQISYPAAGPFHPPEAYPELPWGEGLTQADNLVYPLVRDLLRLLGLDRANFGTSQWNPLGEIIRPGDRVVIKPNFVTDLHRTKPQSPEARLALFTHGSVLRPLVDYAFKACGQRGLITIGDSPMEEKRSESFANVAAASGARTMVAELKRLGVPVNLLDLRDGLYSSSGSIRTLKKLPGDPRGNTIIDLEAESLLEEIAGDAETMETGEWKKVGDYHLPGRHLYSIANTVLEADVVINVPKIKTHKKAGVTLCLKNIMGISNRKDWIPHWRRGIDEHESCDSRCRELLKSAFNVDSHLYQRVLNKLITVLGVKFTGFGNWHGNDTLWRILVDLNKILFFADKQGVMQEERQRRYLVVLDGIIAGEGNSPLAPEPRGCGMVLAGMDPLAVSRVACDLMGVDYRRVQKIMRSASLTQHAFSDCDLEGLTVVGDDPQACAEEFKMADNWETIARSKGRGPGGRQAEPAA